MLLAFHKPFGVISQFTPNDSGHRTLAGFGFPKGVYPIGRLDADSEGLLLLSNDVPLHDNLGEAYRDKLGEAVREYQDSPGRI